MGRPPNSIGLSEMSRGRGRTVTRLGCRTYPFRPDCGSSLFLFLITRRLKSPTQCRSPHHLLLQALPARISLRNGDHGLDDKLTTRHDESYCHARFHDHRSEEHTSELQ